MMHLRGQREAVSPSYPLFPPDFMMELWFLFFPCLLGVFDVPNQEKLLTYL